MTIYFGKLFEFTVEFPDLSSCVEEHQRNYQKYAEGLGVPNAQYLVTPQEECMSIGVEYKSVAVIGKGGFAEVHKALHVKTANVCAIKISMKSGDEKEIMEFKTMSKLRHVR